MATLNSLPLSIREATTVNIFKALVRNFLWIGIVLECFPFFFVVLLNLGNFVQNDFIFYYLYFRAIKYLGSSTSKVCFNFNRIKSHLQGVMCSFCNDSFTIFWINSIFDTLALHLSYNFCDPLCQVCIVFQ